MAWALAWKVKEVSRQVAALMHIAYPRNRLCKACESSFSGLRRSGQSHAGVLSNGCPRRRLHQRRYPSTLSPSMFQSIPLSLHCPPILPSMSIICLSFLPSIHSIHPCFLSTFVVFHFLHSPSIFPCSFLPLPPPSGHVSRPSQPALTATGSPSASASAAAEDSSGATSSGRWWQHVFCPLRPQSIDSPSIAVEFREDTHFQVPG